MLALTGCTGKLGSSVLDALVSHQLLPPSSLVICTSTSATSLPARLISLASQGATIRYSDYDSPTSMVSAFSGCSALLLVSTPRIALDYHDAPPGEGREKHHVAALEAAREAGVEHVYYTSLGFGDVSRASVMRAHLRTEEWMGRELRGGEGMRFTVLREGLYNESWPLYLGYYDVKGEKDEVVVAGDGRVSWTAIADLGLATALVLVQPGEKWAGKTVRLSSGVERKTLREVAELVGEARGKEVKVNVVKGEEYVRVHAEERGMDRATVEWWSSTYEALEDGECDIVDGTLDELLATKGIRAKPVEETIREMVKRV